MKNQKIINTFYNSIKYKKYKCINNIYSKWRGGGGSVFVVFKFK